MGHQTPQEFHYDSSEIERKYSVRGKDWYQRIHQLNQIFEFVAQDKKYFCTLDQLVHTSVFDPDLIAVSQRPVEIKPLRERFYWANRKLSGYCPGDKEKVELRTEKKIGKGYWEQVLKLGRLVNKTLRRGEHKRRLDGKGTNLEVFTDTVSKAAFKVLGRHAILKPLVRLQGQSAKLLYHPKGRKDVLFEIKFDLIKGQTFDGRKQDIVEVEIEVKEDGGLSDKRLDKLLDETEEVLFAKFKGQLEPVYDSKVEKLFAHLVKLRTQDKEKFKKQFEELSYDIWR